MESDQYVQPNIFKARLKTTLSQTGQKKCDRLVLCLLLPPVIGAHNGFSLRLATDHKPRDWSWKLRPWTYWNYVVLTLETLDPKPNSCTPRPIYRGICWGFGSISVCVRSVKRVCLHRDDQSSLHSLLSLVFDLEAHETSLSLACFHLFLPWSVALPLEIWRETFTAAPLLVSSLSLHSHWPPFTSSLISLFFDSVIHFGRFVFFCDREVIPEPFVIFISIYLCIIIWFLWWFRMLCLSSFFVWSKGLLKGMIWSIS